MSEIGSDMDWQAHEAEAVGAIAAASSTAELEDVRVRFLGRKSDVVRALRGVRDRERGMALNGVRERLESAIDARERDARSERSSTAASPRRGVDVTLPGARAAARHLHPITQIRREFEDIFLGLGYAVVDGREVETTRYNFDALNFPEGHPARSPLQTLFLDDETGPPHGDVAGRRSAPWRRSEPPIYVVSPGRVYRRDTPDATHKPMFHQVEGLAVDEGITLVDLLGTLDVPDAGALRRGAACATSAPITSRSPSRRSRRTSRAASVTARAAACVAHSGWIEVGGSGMVDPTRVRVRRLRPRAVQAASRSAGGSSGSRCFATASRTSASSGATTSRTPWGQF